MDMLRKDQLEHGASYRPRYREVTAYQYLGQDLKGTPGGCVSESCAQIYKLNPNQPHIHDHTGMVRIKRGDLLVTEKNQGRGTPDHLSPEHVQGQVGA